MRFLWETQAEYDAAWQRAVAAGRIKDGYPWCLCCVCGEIDKENWHDACQECLTMHGTSHPNMKHCAGIKNNRIESARDNFLMNGRSDPFW